MQCAFSLSSVYFQLAFVCTAESADLQSELKPERNDEYKFLHQCVKRRLSNTTGLQDMNDERIFVISERPSDAVEIQKSNSQEQATCKNI